MDGSQIKGLMDDDESELRQKRTVRVKKPFTEDMLELQDFQNDCIEQDLFKDTLDKDNENVKKEINESIDFETIEKVEKVEKKSKKNAIKLKQQRQHKRYNSYTNAPEYCDPNYDKTQEQMKQ